MSEGDEDGGRSNVPGGRLGERVPALTGPRQSPTSAEERRTRRIRRVGLTFFSALVVAGLLGVFGVTSATTRASAGGLDVELTYARVARPALAVAYQLVIHRNGGFDAPIEVRINSSYLESFDENGSNPEPDSTTTDREDTVWTFPPPDGEVLTVWLDTRVGPGRQWRREGRTTVTYGTTSLTVSHDLWLMP